MTRKTQQELLLQITDAISLIGIYIHGMSREDFECDRKTQDACLMQFHYIGEVATKIRDTFGDISSLPMKEMIGFRNYIAHEYLGIDIIDVWDAIVDDLPSLQRELDRLQKITTKI